MFQHEQQNQGSHLSNSRKENLLVKLNGLALLLSRASALFAREKPFLRERGFHQKTEFLNMDGTCHL